jgi:hypothetical protein
MSATISYYMRISRSFTIEPDISEYVTNTKGKRSASERVNDLLRRAMLQEKYELLETEAEVFFTATGAKDRKEIHAFQTAARRTVERH